MQVRLSRPSTPPLFASLHNHQASPSSATTNSLVLTGLSPIFFHPLVLDALRDHFATYGQLYAWAPLKSFLRVILVYYAEDAAEDAKLGSDGLIIEETSMSPRTVLRVFRADPTPIIDTSLSSTSPFHLKPPPIEKNFLISPPGSPPVGWEQTKEEAPNATPLAEDLIFALRRLQIAREQAETGREGSSISVLIEPEEGVGVGVYVEDCDGADYSPDDDESDSGEGWFYGEAQSRRPQLVPIPTSLPPMRTMA